MRSTENRNIRPWEIGFSLGHNGSRAYARVHYKLVNNIKIKII